MMPELDRFEAAFIEELRSEFKAIAELEEIVADPIRPEEEGE